MAVIVNGDGILTGISSLTTSLTDITSGRGTITGVTTVGTLQLGAGVSISSPRSQQAAIFTNNTEFLTVDDAGRVGIAITNPTTKFDVNGTSKFQDDVTFAGASANITFDKSTDDLIFDDNAQALFGTGSDLKVLHDGTDSYLDHSLGSGLLRINAAAGAEIRLTKSGPETLARFIPDGAVELYHNNTKMLETTADGATLQKGLTVRGVEGGEAQIRIEADEADNASDRFRLVASDSAGFNIQSYDGSQYDNLFSGYINGTVELYHNNVKRLDTISTGIRIHGDEGGTAQLHFLADQGDDNADYWRIIGETSGSILNLQGCPQPGSACCKPNP